MSHVTRVCVVLGVWVQGVALCHLPLLGLSLRVSISVWLCVPPTPTQASHSSHT